MHFFLTTVSNTIIYPIPQIKSLLFKLSFSHPLCSIYQQTYPSLLPKYFQDSSTHLILHGHVHYNSHWLATSYSKNLISDFILSKALHKYPVYSDSTHTQNKFTQLFTPFHMVWLISLHISERYTSSICVHVYCLFSSPRMSATGK